MTMLRFDRPLREGKNVMLDPEELERQFLEELQDGRSEIEDFDEPYVGTNHFRDIDDFMDNFPAQNGQYVIVGYFTDGELKLNRRYVNPQNDEKLKAAIEKETEKDPGSLFGRHFANVRAQQDYIDMITPEPAEPEIPADGKKPKKPKKKRATVDFLIDKPVHLMKACCYNFTWKNSVAYADTVGLQKSQQMELRRKYGFLEPGTEITDDMAKDNWRFKQQYRGAFVQPEETEDGRRGMNKVISKISRRTKEQTDFFQHENTNEIKLRQILAESDMAKYRIYYVQEMTDDNPQGGRLEELDKDTYNLLAYGYKKVEDKIMDLYEDEKEFQEDLKGLNDSYQYREFICQNIMFMIGLQRGVNESVQYMPFVRINDVLCREKYPWVDRQDLENLIDSMLGDAFDVIQQWHATPVRYYDVKHITESKKCRKGRKRLNEGKLKNMAIGAAMLGAVSGGMQSCSPAINEPSYGTEQTADRQHIDFPDYSDRPWAYECYRGRTEEASYLVVQDKYMIKKLIIDLPGNDSVYRAEGYDYEAMWQDCLWAISYQRTEKRDRYCIDVFRSAGLPLDATEYDGSAYFELWYSDDESLSMEDRVEFIKIYRTPETRRETMWEVRLDGIKGTRFLDINDEGPNRH